MFVAGGRALLPRTGLVSTAPALTAPALRRVAPVTDFAPLLHRPAPPDTHVLEESVSLGVLPGHSSNVSH